MSVRRRVLSASAGGRRLTVSAPFIESPSTAQVRRRPSWSDCLCGTVHCGDALGRIGRNPGRRVRQSGSVEGMADSGVNATAAALLGLLHEGPMTGGQLMAAAERRLGAVLVDDAQPGLPGELPVLAEMGFVRLGKPARGPASPTRSPPPASGPSPVAGRDPGPRRAAQPGRAAGRLRQQHSGNQLKKPLRRGQRVPHRGPGHGPGAGQGSQEGRRRRTAPPRWSSRSPTTRPPWPG